MRRPMHPSRKKNLPNLHLEAHLKNPYGHFENEGKEYVITKPDTPRPWFNYLSNSLYHSIISHTGGGYSYYKDCKIHRILQYEDHRSDRPGRYIYIRDQESKEFWSANWQPICKPLDFWKAIHGFGFSRIEATHKNINSQITYFVPRNDPCEVWHFKIKNESELTRTLSVYPYVSFVLGDFYLEQDYKNILLLYNEGYFEKNHNTLVAFKHPTSTRPYETYGFLSSSEKPSGFELDSEKFLGNYGYLSSPETIRKDSTSNTPVRGKEMVGVFKMDVTLSPHEEKEFVFTLGFVEQKKDVFEISKKYQNLDVAKEEL